MDNVDVYKDIQDNTVKEELVPKTVMVKEYANQMEYVTN